MVWQLHTRSVYDGVCMTCVDTQRVYIWALKYIQKFIVDISHIYPDISSKYVCEKNENRGLELRKWSCITHTCYRSSDMRHDPYYSARMPFFVFLGSGEPPCQYHNAIFPSTGLEYFVLECLGPGVPTVALYKTEMPTPRLIAVLQNNTLLRVSFRWNCEASRSILFQKTFISIFVFLSSSCM